MRVIMFHGIGDPPSDATRAEAQYWVDPNQFRYLLDHLHNYNDYELTFDDGNASDIDVAVPALQERGLTARFFVLAGRLNKPGSLSSSDLREMVAAGMSVGSHGLYHVAWPHLSSSDLDQELLQSRRILQDAAGCEVSTASCPFGKYNRTVLKRLRELRYSRIYTSDGGKVPANSWIYPRAAVMRNYGPEELRQLLCPNWYMSTRKQLRCSYRKLRAFAGRL